MKRVFVLVATAASTVVAVSLAHAQPRAEQPNWFEERVPAPSKAVEVTVASGYTQGFGQVQRGVGVPSVATAGVGFDLGAAYRISPRFSFGAVTQYHELNAERASAARGMTAGLDATYHFNPERRLDPWVSIGPGYRLLWEVPTNQPTVLTHGFQLTRARIGLDIRTAESVAIAPFIGADANLFLWEDAGASTVAISDPRIATFVFAGILGRLDIGGTRVGGATLTSASAAK